MYWCYVDESWPECATEKVGVLAAAIGPQDAFTSLDRFMYQVRRKYYGDEHARDRRRELKGSSLLSNNSCKLADKGGYSKNLSVAREVLEWVKKSDIRLIGISVHDSTPPSLLTQDAKALSRPFKELCVRAKAAIPSDESGVLVFDQRVGAQEGISIGVYHYLAGMSDNNTLSPYPLIGVSNIFAGLQLADIAAFIMSRWAIGDNRHRLFYKLVSESQFTKTDADGKTVYGLIRLQGEADGTYTVRRGRPKT